MLPPLRVYPGLAHPPASKLREAVSLCCVPCPESCCTRQVLRAPYWGANAKVPDGRSSLVLTPSRHAEEDSLVHEGLGPGPAWSNMGPWFAAFFPFLS